MPLGSDQDENEWHRKFAVDIFNSIWKLIEKTDRTSEEDEKMLHMAYASCYHWGEVGTPLNQARGEWMISHVNIILKRPFAALHHARRSLLFCENNGFGDFDIAYAYEGMARSNALNKDTGNFKKYHELAIDAGKKIAESGNRVQFEHDMDSGPWFGLI